MPPPPPPPPPPAAPLLPDREPDDLLQDAALWDEGYVTRTEETPDPAALLRLWTLLLSELDFMFKNRCWRWFLRDPHTGLWQQLPESELNNVLYGLGVGTAPRFEAVRDAAGNVIGWQPARDHERDWIKRQFYNRDRATYRLGQWPKRMLDQMPRQDPPESPKDAQGNLGL